ncbi:hypothetical protein [Halomonas elongata]|uniref:Uncharacterized protein n=1 Tax=Halomonas elongata (strain ATCC 33173 / DSM 2581 / NBRC 15536 / NCIMB 2198 / 1H9) TaxID=768066 RepID=E1VAD4_HALED|nr:hypothetical protein [Halomonas elongata]WBF19227.1 hypothetical protein LM502_05930 [Halomonas elongata]WPU48087.1 hypothetical protein SR933_04155 [Halomonas elongata DSM 2581]CBV41980.1 uncharacterized protein HELO_2096 [Halomonas elongata DSM 2581]
MGERLMINTDPKVAWAMAMDSGVRSQMGPILEDLMNGGGVQYTTKGGAGAGHCSEYAPIYACIRRMESDSPALAAIGHVLCDPMLESANAWLNDAVAAVESKVIAHIPNWKDGRAWKPAKKERVHYLIHVALMERQRNLSGAQPEWSPERIGEVMSGWYGVPITTRKWHQDWRPVWGVIQAAMATLEGDAMEPVSEVIGRMVREARAAA